MTTKLFSSVLCVLVLFVSVGTAIRCNYCSPSNSWASCYARLRRVQCASRITSCITYVLKNKNNPNNVIYGVGCANTCNKNDVPDCRPGGRLNCVINCCSFDYCNNPRGSRPSHAPPSTTRWPLRTPGTKLNARFILKQFLRLLNSFKQLIETMEALLRAYLSSADARLGKREVVSMMKRVEHASSKLGDSNEPEVLQAKRDVAKTRTRAHRLIKKLDSFIDNAPAKEITW